MSDQYNAQGGPSAQLQNPYVSGLSPCDKVTVAKARAHQEAAQKEYAKQVRNEYEGRLRAAALEVAMRIPNVTQSTDDVLTSAQAFLKFLRGE